MLERSPIELNFLRPKEAIPTVEVDIDSLPENSNGCAQVLGTGLSAFAAKNPKLVGTIFIMVSPSTNFGVCTYSAFIGVAGPELLLKETHAVFSRIRSVRVRYGGDIRRSDGRLEVHIEDGRVWLCEDDATWYSGERDFGCVLDGATDETDRGQPDAFEEPNGNVRDEQFESNLDMPCSDLDYLACRKCGSVLRRRDYANGAGTCPACAESLCAIDDIPSIAVFFAAGNGDWARALNIIDESKLSPNTLGSPMDNWGCSVGDTLMSVAASQLDLAACQKLFDRGADKGLGRVGGRNTPPIIDVLRNRNGTQGKERRNVIRFLGETVNEPDEARGGRTALFSACTGIAGIGWDMHNGNVGLARLLIDLGADVLISDRSGTTALMHATEDNNASTTRANDHIVRLLKEKTIEQTATAIFKRTHTYGFTDDGGFSLTSHSASESNPAQPTANASIPSTQTQSRTRIRAVRSDARVASIRAKIESHFGLPEGSVALVDGDKKPLRGDALIRTLWKHHQE